jgi:hypothetical protein
MNVVSVPNIEEDSLPYGKSLGLEKGCDGFDRNPRKSSFQGSLYLSRESLVNHFFE